MSKIRVYEISQSLQPPPKNPPKNKKPKKNKTKKTASFVSWYLVLLLQPALNTIKILLKGKVDIYMHDF